MVGKYSNMDYVNQLKRRVDLTELVGEEWLVCEWHEDTVPSLHIYPDGAFCFVCRKQVDVVEVMRTYKGMTWRQAVDWMEANAHDEDVVYAYQEKKHNPLPMTLVERSQGKLEPDSPEWDYLKSRGLYPDMIRGACLGVNNYGIAIPHMTTTDLHNIKTRVLDRDGPKYLSIPHQGFPHLYPWHILQRIDRETLYLTEGEFDALLLLQHGLTGASVPSGATSNLEKYRHNLVETKHVVVIFDQDEPGRKAADGAAKQLDKMGLSTSVIKWPLEWGKDVTDAREIVIPRLRRIHHARMEKEPSQGA